MGEAKSRKSLYLRYRWNNLTRDDIRLLDKIRMRGFLFGAFSVIAVQAILEICFRLRGW